MTPPRDLETLDGLIEKYIEELLHTREQNAKLEGLIKMIKLRHKLAPADSDRREFWTMLNDIRKEMLPCGAADDKKEPESTPDTETGKPEPGK